MSRSPRSLIRSIEPDVAPIVRLWILRMLVPLGAHRAFIRRHDFGNDAIANIMGLGRWVEPSSRDFDARAARCLLFRRHQTAERGSKSLTVQACLSGNMQRLQQLVGLSEVDYRILEFAVLIHTERLLDDVADFLGAISTNKVIHALSVVLDLPERDIRASLSPQGILARSGLVSIARNGAGLLRGKLDLISDHFADAISSSDADPVTLLRGTVRLSSAPHLGLADYAHVTPTLDVLHPYLQRALRESRPGVNIFLHGRPGTGKSQLAKVLAQEFGCELFEVASEDGDGDPVNGEKRLRAFRAAQCFFSQRRALILFDEVEDVFNDGDGFFGRKGTAQARKGWINHILEENPVPTLWLSNSIAGVDPAFLRRFDMIMELPVPTRSHRKRILQDAFADLLPAHRIARISECDALAPAVVTRTAAVVRSIKAELGEARAARAVELLLGNTLEAQGHPPLARHDPNQLSSVYDLAFIHADADLEVVGAGLMQSKAGRLCLYGPPGTGKTAYARWLADRMSIPLHVKRASDLMSMYVGGSEKNVARTFGEAAQERALLLIDEIDSFLQDRREAHRSWEVSLVNEMLTQMESFAVQFIAATNLIEGLDQAALRRFDLKVKFDYLKPIQAAELLRRHCLELAIPAPALGQIARLSRLPMLTPGDFAAVVRQHQFRPLTSADALIGILESECSLKPGAKRAIGFY